jgi:heat shock protein HtpX
VVFKTERGHGIGFYIVTFITEIILGILASTIVMWFSRWREFRADAAGARLAGRDNMIAALQCLQAQQGLPDDMPGEMTALAISSQQKTSFAALFSSHPPLDKRIQALRDAR